MTEADFWELIGKLDWDRTGDDAAVIKPVVEALARRSVSDIEQFEAILAERLFSLDTEQHARQIGKWAYSGPDTEFSVDFFLYVRCCVVANGRAFFENALKNPARMPKDVEFEALLSVAGEAHRLKTGEEFTFVPPVSYETFANAAGWAAA